MRASSPPASTSSSRATSRTPAGAAWAAPARRPACSTGSISTGSGPVPRGNAGNIIRPEDKQNFTRLLAEFRKQLHAYGKQTGSDYLLTAFLPASPAKIDAGFEVDAIFGFLDFATVQGYDLHGAWESVTNHQSNLFTSPSDPSSPQFSVDATVDAYVDRGAPPKELVVGVPFYSRGWTGVAPANNGLFQSATGPAPGTWEAGVDDYKVAKQRLGSGYTRYQDSVAGLRGSSTARRSGRSTTR